MKPSNKFAYILALGVAAVPALAIAASTNIDATANFQSAITLANEVDMDFGSIEYSAAPGAGDTVTLATNGNLTPAGNFSSAATGTVGSVDVTAGTDGLTVEVQCDTTATMAEAGGGTINVTTITVLPEGGADAACQGIGTPAATMVLDIGGGGADNFVFGGIVDGATAAGFVAGAYSTATAGGDDIQIDVIYQ